MEEEDWRWEVVPLLREALAAVSNSSDVTDSSSSVIHLLRHWFCKEGWMDKFMDRRKEEVV